MDEYIKRNSILEKLQERDLCLCVSEADIMDTPAEDVAPVVHGRWKYHKYVQKYECMECGHFVKQGTVINYCPNCGAKMDKEEL